MSTRQYRKGEFSIIELDNTLYWPGGLWFYKRYDNVTRRISRDEYLSIKDNPNAKIVGDTRVQHIKEGKIMNECVCIDCTNKCYEYENNITSNKAYYEWTYKEDKCMAEMSKSEEEIKNERRN